VLAGVGEDEGVGVRAAPLHLLPRRAPLGAAATVVSPVTRKKQSMKMKQLRSICSDSGGSKRRNGF
jgi:hypothetical protein